MFRGPVVVPMDVLQWFTVCSVVCQLDRLILRNMIKYMTRFSVSSGLGLSSSSVDKSVD